MKILYIGDLWYGSTALQRKLALETITSDIDTIDSTQSYNKLQSIYSRAVYKLLKIRPDINQINKQVIEKINKEKYDLMWFDKPLMIKPQTLDRIKQKKIFTISYSPDDMSNPLNQTKDYLSSIKYYDLHVTTKSYNVTEMFALGANDVFFVNNAYDPKIHKPISANSLFDVSFIGRFEKDRLEKLLFAAQSNIPVTVISKQWKKFSDLNQNLKIINKEVWGMEYSQTIAQSKINIGFLSRLNRDLQTTRSIEIPACGGFLLAERTNEHLELFEEGKEAEFFDSKEEMVDKISFYLKNETLRNNIAKNGYNRCISSKYSYTERIKEVTQYLNRKYGIL